MDKNVGTLDRLFRVLGGAAMLTCSVFAPLSRVLRVVGFGLPGIYLLFTALAGTCLGYRMMGKSTCPNTRIGNAG